MVWVKMAGIPCLLVLLVCKSLSTCLCLDPQHYILETNSFPSDDRFRPAIGNGHVATNVLSDSVYMNGVMNGNGSTSHRARIPATSAIDIKDEDGRNATRFYSMDMLNGVFTQTITRDDVIVRLHYFAHRTLSRLLVTVMELERRQPGGITLELSVNRGDNSLDFESPTIKRENHTSIFRKMSIKEPEHPDDVRTSIFQYYTHVPKQIEMVDKVEKVTSVYVTSTSTEQRDAHLAFQRAMSMTPSELYQKHVKAWRDLWNKGHVEVNGDLDLARAINAGFYYIVASLPLTPDNINPFRGLSPGGLSRGGITFPNKTTPYNDYTGHVFWDMDTWILPPIMAFHPTLASIMIGSRTRVLSTVREHARETGYAGARFPWEQGASGREVCPWPPAAEYQIHVTADVSLALRQYLYATNDATILTERKGFELAIDIARFWRSRAIKRQNGIYEILGVMGPDEYHVNIDNSVFTNYNAKLSLTLPAYIRDNYNITVSEDEKREIEECSDVGRKMLILFDEDKQYHPQFQGFQLNESIKQSDVVLLGFPLLMPMSHEVRRNDLLIYENLTDEFGPDTGTWSMHALTRLELEEEQQAEDDFGMMFRNINGPFKIFSEKPPNNPQGVRAVNFLTGAGGLLQAVLFGYGGIRLHSDHLEIHPHLLPNNTEWAIRGFHYRGFRLDIEVVHQAFRLTLLSSDDESHLNLIDEGQSSRESLKVGVTVERHFQKVRLSVRKGSSSKPPVSSICLTKASVTLVLFTTVYFLLCE